MLFHFNTGKKIKTFHGHKDTVYSLAISVDGKFIISGSRTGEIKVWSIDNE